MQYITSFTVVTTVRAHRCLARALAIDVIALVHEPFDAGSRKLYELAGPRISPASTHRITQRVKAAAEGGHNAKATRPAFLHAALQPITPNDR